MKYKGYEISQEYDLRYYGTDPEADYDYIGDPGQHVQCNGMPTVGPCKSIEDVKTEIDESLKECAECVRMKNEESDHKESA